MIITVASGKGGTGKTTVATNLAVAMESDAQVLDCDVEEPNAHLFLKPEISDTTTATTPVPEIDLGKCTLCGECMEVCPTGALKKTPVGEIRIGIAVVEPDTCLGYLGKTCRVCQTRRLASHARGRRSGCRRKARASGPRS